MNQAGNHILAGARFAGDQHRYPGRGHLVDQKLDVADGLGVADEPHLILRLAGTVAKHGIFPGEQHPLVRFFDDQIEPVEIERFADEFAGAQFHGLYRDVDIAVAGDHDHFDVGDRFPDSDQQVKVGDIRQPQVHDDDVEPVAADHGHGLGAVCQQ